MGRAFQTAIYLHKPEIVFVLGKLIYNNFLTKMCTKQINITNYLF